MSNYENFLYDFPKRCKILLEFINNNRNMKHKLEVTAYLALFGYSALVVHEVMLDKNAIKSTRTEENEFAREYDELMGSCFLNSIFCNEQTRTDWKTIKEIYITKNSFGNSLDLSSKNLKNMSEIKKTKGVFDTIRNSLAHANTYMDGSGEITRINFINLLSSTTEVKDVTVDKLKIGLISCSVDSFKFLGNAWFDLVDRHSFRRFGSSIINAADFCGAQA